MTTIMYKIFAHTAVCRGRERVFGLYSRDAAVAAAALPLLAWVLRKR